MNQEERLKQIKELVTAKEFVTSNELLDYFQVSKDTIRRDLLLLAQQGEVKRVHGGVMPIDKTITIPSYSDRIKQLTTEKNQMAEIAAEYLMEGGIYFFDVSTIILKLAQLISEWCVVYTHSLDNSIALSVNDRTTFHLLGGEFFKNDRYFYEKEQALAMENIAFDCVFLGACAINEHGIFFREKEDAWIKAAVIRNSQKIVVLAENEKLGKHAHYLGAPLAAIDILITDKPLSEEQRQWLPKTIKCISL